ncbi:GMC family oxidoreductase N-terminal domain-containing protein [Rhodophyticola porphyridii]|uniref:GMC family oxidoreductase N-terminal domain-containing protein n=1 Tax=Rhodophyticola porphyridii TaxID=1852017 RepID=UPI0035D066BD
MECSKCRSRHDDRHPDHRLRHGGCHIGRRRAERCADRGSGAGDHLADSPAARDPQAIFRDGVFRPDETWLDGQGEPFNPGNYYCVGGNSKFYGAALIRFRETDFAPVRHMGGTTSGWPFDYAELEPWYQAAEEMYEVRGCLGEDPTEPPHSGRYPHPPVPDEPEIAALRARLVRIGLHPSSLPLAVDLPRWLARGQTPWDAFPDTDGSKMDAESVGMRRALSFENVTLHTGMHVDRLLADDAGRITAVQVTGPDGRSEIAARSFVLAAGAVNSAAILLRSATDAYPNGLANRSDQVGRNFMNHNCSAALAIHPWRKIVPSIKRRFRSTTSMESLMPATCLLATFNCLGASPARSSPRRPGCRGPLPDGSRIMRLIST